MENKTTNDLNGGQQNKEPQSNKSWIERNLWLIAVGVAIFILRMCSELSK